MIPYYYMTLVYHPPTVTVSVVKLEEVLLENESVCIIMGLMDTYVSVEMTHSCWYYKISYHIWLWNNCLHIHQNEPSCINVYICFSCDFYM